jgi:hypothetical protein
MQIFFLKIITFLFTTSVSISSSSSICLEKKILTSFSTSISGQHPILPCSKCKWFIKNENKDDFEDGFCEIFKNTFFLSYDFENHNKYKHVNECRKNDSLCGKNAYYFEPKIKNHKDSPTSSISDENMNFEELQYLREKMIEMEQQNCGEVNENYDLDNWDKEYKQIKNRIEKIMNRMNRN